MKQTLLLTLIFTIAFACGQDAKRKEMEKNITGSWIILTKPKFPDNFKGPFPTDTSKYIPWNIFTFTKEHLLIDSSWLDLSENHPKETQKHNIKWSISDDLNYLVFKNSSQNTNRFKIKKISNDTIILNNVELNVEFLFLNAKNPAYEKYNPDEGLSINLPPKRDKIEKIESYDKNVFKILVNSKNQILAEEEPVIIEELRKKIKNFINNYGKDSLASSNPQEAVITYKTDRGTKYSVYIRVLDEIRGAYHELRAEYLKIPIEQYLSFDEKKDLEDKALLKKVRLFNQFIGENFDAKKYLEFNPKTNKIYNEAYQKVRNTSPDLFIEKYYDAQKVYPIKISEVEPPEIKE